MNVDQEQDPFSLLYDTLWALAEQSPRLTSLVRLRNRIKFNERSRSMPTKEEVGDADLPELTLVKTQGSGKIRATSSSSMCLLTFEWWLANGDPSLTRALMPLEFAVFAAMAPWPTTVAPLVEWRGKTFIKRLDLNTSNSVLNDQLRNRGIMGWSCMWACEVETWYTTDDVIAASGMTLQ